MRATPVVATALLLLSGNGIAKAADPTRLAETGGFLLGNAHRCGIETERVEHSGTVIHDMIVSASYDPTGKLPPIRALPGSLSRALSRTKTVTRSSHPAR